jgi:hypothetical protein
MSSQIIHVEHLLGRKVRDSEGRKAGRIEEIRCQNRQGQCRVSEYLLGGGGLMERLSVPDLSLTLIRLLGSRRFSSTHRVPWNQMDLADPKHPKLRCRREELEQSD